MTDLRKRLVLPLTLAAALVLVIGVAIRYVTTDRTGRGAKTGEATRTYLLGVDGADWEIIERLIAADRLPNFKTLVERGATGPLRSIEPLLSPLLWTTMATGKLPEEHGVLSFTIADPSTGKKVPVSRLYRKVDAFWNMLSDYDRAVSVVGWLATFPAEPIDGVMVTDRVGYLAYAEGGGAVAGSVSPEARLDDVASLVVPSASITWEEFRRFVHVDRETFLKNRAMTFDPKNPINNMIMLYASTRTFNNIANRLADEQPSLLAVYFELVDATKHLFMHYAPPREADVDENAYALCKDAVDEAYVYQDSIIGSFIERCDREGAVLMVVSDHGFKSGVSRPKFRPEIWAGKAAFWHRIDGIVCFYGRGIRRGAQLTDASILDIAPTILALQGLPRAEDLPGTILEGAFDEAFLASMNRATVPTLQRKRQLDDMARATDDASTDEALKKLEALGYITPDNPDAHNNLGQRLQAQGKYEDAIEEFRKALAINPNFSGALNNMGVCYGKLRRYPEAKAAFEKALEVSSHDVYALNNLAVMHVEMDRLDEALRYSARSVEVEPRYANGHVTLGSIYATMGKFELAEKALTKALEIDPANQGARINLEKVQRELSAHGQR
jgi:Flp pilus assembly protein TadD